MRLLIVSPFWLSLAAILTVKSAASFELFSKARYDFDGLNKWLMENHKDDDDSKANLEEALQRISQIKDISVARTVGLLMELSNVDECYPGVLKSLRDVNEGGIKVNGHRRIENVMRPHLERIIELCEPYLDDTIKKLYETSLRGKMDNLFEVIHAEDLELSTTQKSGITNVLERQMDPHYYYYTGSKFSNIYDPSLVEWADFIVQLSHHDPETRFEELFRDTETDEIHMFKNRDKFNLALKKYVREPCELLNDITGDLYEGAWALEGIQYSLEDKYELFLKRRSILFNRLFYNLKVCRVFLNMSPIRIEKIYNDVAEFPSS